MLYVVQTALKGNVYSAQSHKTLFRFGKQRAKSSDAMRSSGRKTPSGQDSSRQTPTDELDRREDEAREKMVHEQAKIQQHYQRLLQQRQHSEVVEQQRRPEERSEAVYSGEPALPASLVAARPGSRSGISGTPTDPRFANYEEIQRHLNRRQAQYHSQVTNSLLVRKIILLLF